MTASGDPAVRSVLAVDTSTPWGGVALVERSSRDVAPAIVGEIGIGVDRSHAGWLIQRIDALLRLTQRERAAIDLFVACRGPGSFTGLRIGLGTVRGLAVAAGKPAVGVETLRAMAEAMGPGAVDRMPVLIAGRGEYYAAVYDADGRPPEPRAAPFVAPPGELQRLAEDAGCREAVCFGPGAEPVAQAGGWGERFRVATSPRGIAAAAAMLAIHDATSDPETTLAPIYVRPPDASIGGKPSPP